MYALTSLNAADSVVLVFAKSEQPASLSAAEVKDLVKTITPTLRSVKTAKKNIKVTVRLNSAEKEADCENRTYRLQLCKPQVD